VEKVIRELNLVDKVLFTGFLGGVDKLEALVDADILIQSSMREAGARPSLEGILCDTPIIVSKGTGASEEVSNINAGYLVEYGNVNELRDTIQYILKYPSEVKGKTKKAKDYIMSNLSFSEQIVKYEELYGGKA